MDSINYSKDSSNDDAIAYHIAHDLLPGLDSSSTVKHKGSMPGKRPIFKRDFVGTNQLLIDERFGESPKYSKALFQGWP